MMEPATVNSLKERLSQWGFSWEGLRDNRRGEWWLIAQLALITAHLLPPLPPPAALGLTWPLGLRLLGWGVFVLGLLLAGLAVGSLAGSLTPLPEPMPNAPLVTSGAYGRCRHPLYQAVLVCSLGATLALGSLAHLALLLALAVVLSGQGPQGGEAPAGAAPRLWRLSGHHSGDRGRPARAGLAVGLCLDHWLGRQPADPQHV
jgi:protein-S-isoprenylcysteine O-methyltransferase Ste14